ncbi:MAG: DNA-protecting protein DprA [Calditrichaeota bacterium]|nr:DNA-protecting protein DprA [Calditrichota bacterium]
MSNESGQVNITDEFRLALLVLLGVNGIGHRRAIELARLFGSPQNALLAPAGEIAAALNVPLAVGRAVAQAGRNKEATQKVFERVQKASARLVSYWDVEYPSRLKNIADPPALLFVKGAPSPLYDYAVAIVGTRAPSDHCTRLAQRLAADLAMQGIAVVSGMAVGIDGMAHEGALNAGGRTVAVLGTGIDVIYPSIHRKLYERIVQQGMVISELPPGESAEPHNFPQRNRIISGMSIGVVIVEAGLKSGALITARCAVEQGRELFAVPGAAGTHRAAGVNRLIKDGAAIMIESAAEIVERLKSQLAPVLNVAAALTLPKLSINETKVYNLLEKGPMLIDDIIRNSGLGAVEVNRMLTAMQLRGLVKRIAGARVERL